jgi:hypothetical protein
MTLPPGVTEQQLMASIENATRLLATTFSFGIYDCDDVRQEIGLEVVRVLHRYDPQPDANGNATRPLENFAYVVAKNRLMRLRRDKLRRPNPCRICERAVGNRTEHDDGQFCRRYLAWKKRNDAKAGLMRPLGIDTVPAEEQRSTRMASDVAEQVEADDLLAMIDRNLDVELRATYLQMRAGKSVPKARRVLVEEAIREILAGVVEV